MSTSFLAGDLVADQELAWWTKFPFWSKKAMKSCKMNFESLAKQFPFWTWFPQEINPGKQRMIGWWMELHIFYNPWLSFLGWTWWTDLCKYLIIIPCLKQQWLLEVDDHDFILNVGRVPNIDKTNAEQLPSSVTFGNSSVSPFRTEPRSSFSLSWPFRLGNCWSSIDFPLQEQ